MFFYGVSENPDILIDLLDALLCTTIHVYAITEWIAKTRQSHFSVLQFTTFFVHFFLSFVYSVYYTLIHLSYHTLFQGFLQTTLVRCDYSLEFFPCQELRKTQTDFSGKEY